MPGARETKANISKELAERKRGARAGAMAAGHLVERRSKALVPREYGNLVNSGYTQPDPDNPNGVIVGYTANYAAAVHEKIGMKLKGKPRPSGKGVYWGPKGEAKFLEKPFRESRDDIKRIIASYTKKGK